MKYDHLGVQYASLLLHTCLKVFIIKGVFWFVWFFVLFLLYWSLNSGPTP
jgi:hypothetical protein